MKRAPVIGLGVIVMVGSVFFLLPNEEKSLKQVSERAEEKVASTLVPELHTHDTSSSCTCSSSHSSNHLISKRSVDAAPIVFSDFPASSFRDSFVNLSEQSQKRVLTAFNENPVLLNDIESLQVDANGMILYVCNHGAPQLGLEAMAAMQAQAIEGAPEGEDAEPTVSYAPVAISAPPIYHSRPGASKVMFLDFNGHVVENTAWNNPSNLVWDCRPYDIDGDETTFSDTEQNNIKEIWERVAEDYAAFDIDVTTEEPAVWDRFKGRVLITPGEDKNGADCPHKYYGGVAYVDVFGKTYYEDYSISWVLDYDYVAPASFIAESASHEFGHNLGLHHDGASSEYYGGHTEDEISWGPIMGTGYYRNISQWSKGEYFGASNTEDDLLIIASKLTYRPDDHGDTKVAATFLETSLIGEIDLAGVVEQTDDKDVFYFDIAAGELNIAASAYQAPSSTWGGNVDIKLELYNDADVLVAENNPRLSADASISQNLPAGTYYLHLIPVGAGTPEIDPPSGYTSYGSLGAYTLSGSIAVDLDDDGLPNEWELAYFEDPTDAMPDDDFDGDGVDNLSEYIAGTLPNDVNSVFAVSDFQPNFSEEGVTISWSTAAGRVYDISWSGDLASGFEVIASGLPASQTSYLDTVDRGDGPSFYRVDVRLD